jgi:outer membrane receptor protein involved in Fe transport
MFSVKRYCQFLALILPVTTTAVHAADESAGSLDEIQVVGSTPLAGSDIERDRVPAATRVLSSKDIDRTGIPSLTSAILANVPSASINDVEGNVFQPDILFRGFTASPVAGTPEGLAVYVNGARFNDAFGDTVNWDLIPPSAIKTVSIEAANPVFGLNALGGAVSVQLKNGFSDEPDSVTAFGGSYGRRAGILEFSRQAAGFAIYVAADVTHDDGFRQTSASDLYRLYADLGWRSGPAEVHLSLTAAHDRLGNPGASPVQALAADISNIFTAPNSVDNKYAAANLNGTYKISDSLSLQSVGYFQNLRQYVPNGITTQVAPCADGSGSLCNDDGSAVTTFNSQPVADFLNGGLYSGLSVQQLQSHAYGATVQATDQRLLGGLLNRLVTGVSFDGAETIFSGVQEIGGFDPYSREFIGPGVVQDQPSIGVNPVRVRTMTRFYGGFASDVVTLTPNLDVTMSGRFNDAQINLTDELGGPVTGRHTYNRFNPSAGLAYRLTSGLQIYGSYSETNRAPTPQELSCASPAAPCSLLNFFVGDPDLHQVVARTYEAGVRGKLDAAAGSTISWNADLYHTQNTDDIIFESTVYNPNLAFYTNAGKTRRQGVEANLRFDAEQLHVKLGYAFTDATFRTPLVLNSGNNPAADGNGQIQVSPGDRIPGIPRHRANVVVDYSITSHWSVGGEAVVQSSVYRFGDESNSSAPVGGYTIIDLNAAFRPVDNFTVFVVVNNALNKRYDTYGTFGPIGDVPWPNIPGGVTDPRTASPGMPIAAYGGVRLTF